MLFSAIVGKPIRVCTCNCMVSMVFWQPRSMGVTCLGQSMGVSLRTQDQPPTAIWERLVWASRVCLVGVSWASRSAHRWSDNRTNRQIDVTVVVRLVSHVVSVWWCHVYRDRIDRARECSALSWCLRPDLQSLSFSRFCTPLTLPHTFNYKNTNRNMKQNEKLFFKNENENENENENGEQ